LRSVNALRWAYRYNPAMKRILALLLLASACAGVSAQSLTAEKGWIRSAPPGAAMLAGYVRLSNSGDGELRILQASSSAFESVEIHRTIEEDGVARMRPVSFVVIPPGQSVDLEPGGLHLMLIRPRKKLIVGDNVVIDLVTSEGEELPAVFKVSSGPADAAHEHHHHH
jgi:periplasmic copper chaperone A